MEADRRTAQNSTSSSGSLSTTPTTAGVARISQALPSYRGIVPDPSITSRRYRVVTVTQHELPRVSILWKQTTRHVCSFSLRPLRASTTTCFNDRGMAALLAIRCLEIGKQYTHERAQGLARTCHVINQRLDVQGEHADQALAVNLDMWDCNHHGKCSHQVCSPAQGTSGAGDLPYPRNELVMHASRNHSRRAGTLFPPRGFTAPTLSRSTYS